MKRVFTVVLFGLFFTSFSMAKCINCSVEVVIHELNTQRFLDTLLTINSMPLTSYQVFTNQVDGYNVVQVETFQEYADANKLSSFDIAKRILQSFGTGPEWDIRKISATVDQLSDDQLSNVGTIGH